uniref:Microsomal glutathione s-transferase n=1 Tax=Pyropia yezoensis TaxID=2788 RepID=A0A1W6C2K4_PYRYE|nr:microsomal glutathione s-transferase [Neopyropia yezoensis]
MTSAFVPLPGLYGAVILTAVVNWFVLMWMALMVGSARKEHGVKYPLLYENKVTSQFDLVQRAHQNSLEWNTSFLVFLLIGGLSLPLSCAVAGTVYNVGRVFYAKGYYSGNPHKGLWGLYGLFYLLGATVFTAYKTFTA